MHADKTFSKELELGVRLGAIIQDEVTRTRLIERPAETLRGAGVKPDVTIYADTADMVHLIVPAEVDAERVAAEDESYFEELGKLALGSCVYKELPR
ncbi:hypothetical protein [Roseibium sp.]|uniref:hypothetical protein n=1 Tax=Roseibium sp. TaxID=1936156 RepID=UPI003D0A255F